MIPEVILLCIERASRERAMVPMEKYIRVEGIEVNRRKAKENSRK